MAMSKKQLTAKKQKNKGKAEGLQEQADGGDKYAAKKLKRMKKQGKI